MTATTATPTAPPSKNVFRLHGVNVLNRKNVDSISRLTALEKRRATHILDERQRRDTMNQLLAELANLVRESAAEVAAAQQQQQQEQHLNADGTEKKAPVKSNSITTLRNAITEIRRLRSCAGLETTTPPCAASLAVISPNASRSSSPISQTSYSKKQLKQEQQQQQQVQLPALAPTSQYSTPASSPKAYASQVPPMASYYHHQQQLQSPPLSPSSPDSHQYHPSSVSPPTMTVHSTPAPQLPSLFANHQSASPYNYQSQSQQYNHQQQQPQYYSQYSAPSQYESYSRSASPSSSGYSSSTAPSMILPQPYMHQQQQQYPAYAPM
ncbi:hypothetical protein K457DRAFT_132236 [Linnemannia elongata AG-77]|uniref:BHLH domain-containing protein n=1 Tax=Linnemannia elongata AG-77 TaxID=1314771 RepID=A0A197KEW0_9FUNG|nr:hypothetical protein K457DRAFT_132236 [Linnemannia elongata AG-77]